MSVPAQRNIEIVANPGGQTDGPSVPEVREVNGRIGLAKVLLQTESKSPAQSDRHVRETTKIEVDLGRKTQDADPGHGHIELRNRDPEYLISHVAEAIGN